MEACSIHFHNLGIFPFKNKTQVQFCLNCLFSFFFPPADGIQVKPEKIRSSLKNVKKDTEKPEKLKFKPLTGKVFYLDIPSNVISEKLGKDLKELGGVS